MRTLTLSLLASVVLAVALPAADQVSTPPPAPAPAAAPAVDPAATKIWAQHIEGMGDRGEGPRAVNNAQVIDKALEFFEKYPEERRVSGILYNVASFGEWIQGPDAERILTAWRAHLRGRLADTLQHHPWPDHIWAGLQWVAAKNDWAISVAAGHPDLAAFHARIATVAARAPEAPHRIFLEQEYVRLLEVHEPAALEAYLTTLAQSDVKSLATLGRGQLTVQRLKTTPMELKFTAVDGREVDLAALRGQVVLIDCWATWCVPCVKELPYVKAALAKWGPKGFAVVGISFDRLPDRAKLVKFIADEKLDWPHWFNEQGGKNPFGERYDIRSIPATFLLGRDGRLVATEVRGEKLDAELQRLLGP